MVEFFLCLFIIGFILSTFYNIILYNKIKYLKTKLRNCEEYGNHLVSELGKLLSKR